MMNRDVQELYLPLHHAQKEIVYSEMSAPLSAHTNLGGYLRINGKINTEVFLRSLKLAIVSFDIFKIKFHEEESGDICQSLSDTNNGTVEYVDMSHLKDESLIIEYLQERFNIPFKTLDNNNHEVQLLKYDENTYYWFLRFNHAIQDGAGILPLVKRCSEIYNKINNKESVDQLPVTRYLSEVKNSQEYIESEKYNKDKEYWLSRFKCSEESLFSYSENEPLPISSRVSFYIDKDMRLSLYEACGANNVSIQNIYMAAIGLYVSQRYNKNIVQVGTVVHNRKNKTKRNLAGMLSGNLATSLDIQPGQTTKELITTIKRQQRSDFKHQSFPISHLQNILGKKRLFEIMFNYQPLDFQVNFGDASGTTHYLSSNNEHHPLQIRICDYGESQDMECIIDYREDCFTENETVEIYNRITHVISQLLASKFEVTCKDIQVYTEDEISTALSFSTGECVVQKHHTVASAIVESSGFNNIAITDGKSKLTYQELFDKCCKISRLILNTASVKAPRVAICMNRSIDLPQVIYSTILAGGSYIPIETTLPEKRIVYIIDDSQADLILCDKETQGFFAGSNTPCIAIDDAEITNAIRSLKAGMPEVTVNPDDACYIIYTSGTTGEPKGVINEHEAVVNRIAWMQNQYGVNGSDKLIQKTPYGFDVSVWEFLLPIFSGATLFVAKPDGHKEVDYLVDTINQNGITTIHFVPSMLSAFLEDESSLSCQSLKRVICSGEALPLKLQNTFIANFMHCRLINLYGPTEAAIDVTHWECMRQDEGSSVPIGYPIENVEILILDQNNKPVPIGVPGELHIGGIAPARGYVNKVQLTQEKFITLEGQSKTIYKSGDLACWLYSGAIEYLGRIDDQIKIRGLRIELSEVEHAIRQSEQVSSCTVCAVEEKSGSKKLVAFFVRRSTCLLSREALSFMIKERITSLLPDYMIPTLLVEVDNIPLSKNGKADKKKLTSGIKVEDKQDRDKPVTDFEVKVANELSSVLNIEQVYLNDNFFSIGGDSILALKFISKLKKLDLTLKLSTLLREPIVSSIVNNIETRSNRNTYSAIDVNVENSDDPMLDTYLTSDMQAGVIFHSQRNKQSGVYHDVFTFIYNIEMDIDVLQQAINLLTEQNEMLRTTFKIIDGKQCQVVLKGYEHTIKPFEYNISPSIEFLSAEIEAFTSNERKNDFDFNKPPLRIFVHQNHSGFCGVTFSFHLSILDGWSIHSLNSTLISHYSSIVDGREIKEARKPKYKEYIKLEKEVASSPQAISFWEKRGGTSPAPIWLDNKKSTYSTLKFDLDKKNEQEVVAFAQSNGVHERDVYLAIHFRFLSRIFGCTEVTSSVVMNGRPEIENSDLTFGQFLCSPPLSVDLKNRSAGELVSAIKDEINEVFPYRYFPLSEIQKMWGEHLSVALFNYVNFHVYKEGVNDSYINPKHFVRFEETNFLIETNIYKSSIDESTSIELVIDDQVTCNIFDSSIEEIYHSAIASVIHDTANTTRLLPCAVGENIPLASNSLVELFDTSCWDNMEQDALLVGDRRVSYSELFQRVSALASYLSDIGCGQGRFVAIMMERSENLVYAIHSSIKSGAAYIPIDPTYPEERIEYMLSNSTPALVLCDTANESILQGLGYDCLNIDQIDFLSLSGAKNSPVNPVNIGGDDPCYMIYTSGTTGNPKGVINSHQAVANRILWMQKEYQLTSSDTVLQKTPYSFDVSVWEFLWPLFFGSSLVIAKPNGHIDTDYLINEIVEKEVTTLHFVPSMLEVFTNNPNYVNCTSLKRMFCSGEALPVRLQDTVLSGLDLKLYNLYGPTEAAIDVTHWQCSSEHQGKSVPIGYPVDNVNLYILNDNLEPVPAGVPGELVIGGVAVAKGYHKQETLTAEKFIDCGSDRIYRTGDLVRLMPCGAIEYMGRIDEQVKINGLRIELGEIESAMKMSNVVKSASVIMCNSNDGRQYIAAYYVAEQSDDLSQEGTNEQILQLLSRKLPAYMLPSYLKQVDEIPLSPSGKLNRKALPAPSFDGNAIEKAENQTQAILLELFKTLTLTASVGINDDFFILGGDSLAALRLVSEAAKSGLSLSINDVYELKTVKRLSMLPAINQVTMIEEEMLNYPWLPNRSAVFRQMANGATLDDMNHWTWSSYLTFDNQPKQSDIEQTIRLLLEDCTALRASTDLTHPNKTHTTLDTNQIAIEQKVKNVVEQSDLKKIAIEKIKAIDLRTTPISFTIVTTGEGIQGLLVVFHHLMMDSYGMAILSNAFDHYYDRVIHGKLPQQLIRSRLSEYSHNLYSAAQKETAEECRERYVNLFADADSLLELNSGMVEPESNLVLQEGIVYRKIAISKEKLKSTYGMSSIERLVSATVIKAIGESCGLNTIKLELRHHGRKSRLTDVDVSSTIGYFSESVPIMLAPNHHLPLVDSLREISVEADVLLSRHDSFGAHRYMSQRDDVKKLFSHYVDAEIAINVLPSTSMDSLVHINQDKWYQDNIQDKYRRSENLDRVFLLDIKAECSDELVSISIGYSKKLIPKAIAEKVMDITYSVLA